VVESSLNKYECLSCGATWNELNIDGTLMFHNCPEGTNNPVDTNWRYIDPNNKELGKEFKQEGKGIKKV
tara:strand:- start:2165 stop:2371 length:207 start_codon:yes stop_codon:yes gene_type:complete